MLFVSLLPRIAYICRCVIEFDNLLFNYIVVSYQVFSNQTLFTFELWIQISTASYPWPLSLISLSKLWFKLSVHSSMWLLYRAVDKSKKSHWNLALSQHTHSPTLTLEFHIVVREIVCEKCLLECHWNWCVERVLQHSPINLKLLLDFITTLSLCLSPYSLTHCSADLSRLCRSYISTEMICFISPHWY